MNFLSHDKQITVVGALAEGCSIRTTERLTGVHRDTIMRLGVRVGEHCETLHDRMVRNLAPHHVRLDELWSFVGKKQRNPTRKDSRDVSNQYVFLALHPSCRSRSASATPTRRPKSSPT